MAIETMAAILGGKPGRKVRGITCGVEYFVFDGYVFWKSRMLGTYFGPPPEFESYGIGFRVAMIPEPSTALLLACGLAGLAVGGRRRA